MHDELLLHQTFLERLARQLVADEAAAQDLVQDAWVRALERPPRERGALRAWFATVARRLANERARGGRRRLERERGAARDEWVEGGQGAIDRRLDFQALLFERLRALPEAQRHALAMRYVEDLSPPAIAERLGVPVETVRTRLRRGLATLREELDRRTGGDRSAWAVALLPHLDRGGRLAAIGGGGGATLLGGGIFMSAGTKVAAAALVMSALAGGWWLLGGEGEGAARPAPDRLAALEPRIGAPSELRSAGTPSGPEGAPAAAREALSTPSAGAGAPGVPGEELQSVRVVERSSGAPLPRAEVRWLNLGGHDARTRELARSVASVDGLLEERGELIRADAEGIARIPRAAGELAITGRSPGLWGWSARFGDAPDELRLELVPDASVDVEVVDSRGSPVAGIPVVLWGSPREVRALVRTGAEGRARLPHVLAPDREGRPVTTLSAGVLAVLREPLRQELDPDALPRGPLRLVLPPTGSLEVAVRHLDGTSVASGSASVQREIPPPAPVLAYTDVERGRALFEHVEPGLDLRLSIAGDRSHRSTIHVCAGPSSAGQRLVVEVVLGSDHPVLRLRALDEGGSPLGEALLHTGIGVPGELSWGLTRGVRTDAEGRFELHLFAHFQHPDRPRLLRVRQAPGPGTPAREATRELAGLYEPGLHELGELHLAPAPLVAAGLVLDPRGEPLAGASVRALLLDVGGRAADGIFPADPRPTWRGTGLVTQSAADGSFALHGSLPPGRTLLAVSHSDLAPNSIEFQRGASDLRLQLSGTATLAGRVETDAASGVERLAVRARLESSGGIPADALGVPDGWSSLAKRPSGSVRADGSFVVPRLKPGRWTLSVVLDYPRGRAGRPGSVLREVEGIEVRAGEATRDPRLDPIDLRGLVRPVRIEIVPPVPGAPLHGFCGWRESGTSQVQSPLFAERGEVELALMAAPLDVELAFRGYRPVSLESVSEDRRVELAPGLPVRLRLPAGLRFPEGPHDLLRVGGGSYRLVAVLRFTGPLGLAGVSSEMLPFDERGEASLIAGGPGSASVRLELMPVPDHPMSLQHLVGGPGREIQLVERDAEQLIVIDVTQAELDAALAALLD